MTTHEDDELRAGFDRLRTDDTMRAPSFGAMWELAGRRAHAVPSPVWRVPTRTLSWLAAAALVILAVGLFRERASERARARRVAAGAPNAVTSITAWRSPTQSLLRTSGSELLASPSVLSSVLGGVTRPTVQRRGE